MKFKKITAIATSVLMTGLTVASAAAAAFPAPFVNNGQADVAIVYGADADMVAANNVHTALGKFVTSTGAQTVTGGEAYKLEKSSDKFNFGDDLDSVRGTITDEEMDVLADGTYDDGSIDEDYSQEITLGAGITSKLISDEDVNNEAPTIGFEFSKDDEILKYTMDYDSDDVKYADMNTTDMPIFGSDYYVISADSSTIELLDTAEKNTLNLDESATIADKVITVSYIGDNKVKFSVDGVSTDSLEENEQYELDDGSYIIPTDIMTSTKDSVMDSVEFSIGSGKITLHNGGTDEVELNDDDVDGLFANWQQDGTSIDDLSFSWKADDTTFLYEGNTLSMPLFNDVKLAFNGLDFSTDSENVVFDHDDTLTIRMDNYDVPVMWVDGSGAYFGEKNHELLVAPMYVNTTSDFTDNVTVKDATHTIEVLPVKEDQRFVVTRILDDLSDVETLYYEVNTIDPTDADVKLSLDDMVNGNDLEFDSINDDHDRGDVTVTLEGFNAAQDTAYISFAAGSDNITYNKIVSDKGMVITLPSAVADADGEDFTVTEANEDGDIAQGANPFTVTVKADTTDEVIYALKTSVPTEEESSDVYVGYNPSELASKVTLDKSGDENDFNVEYYGKEVTADLEVILGGEVSATAAADFLPVKASDIDSVKDKNLVIVGGSCINAAAATALGGAYCGEAFTEATGVSAGQFLIEEVMDKFSAGKTALVVAGYEAADTKNAVTYLTKMEDVDTSAKIVKGLESVQNLA